MKIRVSSLEREMLLGHPETRDQARKCLDENESLEGTPEQLDALRECCSDLLQRIGFDADYNPTEEGKLLERLIDRLLV